MNEIILDMLETIKEEDEDNTLGMKDHSIREEYSINRSFRRGSSTTAQLMQVPTEVIELVNQWKNIQRAKGKRPSFSMIETYADIEILIPKMVQYSVLL